MSILFNYFDYFMFNERTWTYKNDIFSHLAITFVNNLKTFKEFNAFEVCKSRFLKYCLLFAASLSFPIPNADRCFQFFCTNTNWCVI